MNWTEDLRLRSNDSGSRVLILGRSRVKVPQIPILFLRAVRRALAHSGGCRGRCWTLTCIAFLNEQNISL